MKNNLPKINYENVSVGNSNFVRGDKKWKIATLVDHVKENKLKPFDLPLAGVPLSSLPFKCDSLDMFIYQMKRTLKTNLDYPIILDDFGDVCDGNHRVAKAILKGHKTIKAVRIMSMPEPDSTVIDK